MKREDTPKWSQNTGFGDEGKGESAKTDSFIDGQLSRVAEGGCSLHRGLDHSREQQPDAHSCNGLYYRDCFTSLRVVESGCRSSARLPAGGGSDRRDRGKPTQAAAAPGRGPKSSLTRETQRRAKCSLVGTSDLVHLAALRETPRTRHGCGKDESRKCSPQVDSAQLSNGTPKAIDLNFGQTLTATAPNPRTNSPNSDKNPPKTTGNKAGPPDDFLPPETNDLIRRLTVLSRRERLQAIQQISHTEREKICTFLQQTHMKECNSEVTLPPPSAKQPRLSCTLSSMCLPDLERSRP